jgi:hypothetical protein
MVLVWNLGFLEFGRLGIGCWQLALGFWLMALIILIFRISNRV